MKRLPAILFFAILLFNFVGYQLMLDCMQDRQEEVFSANLDQNRYSDADLISIKTPMDVPYYTNSAAYERTYGSINVRGVDYEYVKRRVYNDTLEVLCLPNKAKTAIRDTRNEFLKHNLDGTNTGSSKKSGRVAKISLPDYCQELPGHELAASFRTGRSFAVARTAFRSSDFSLRQERPPQV